MKTTPNEHSRLLFSTLALLSVARLAVPHAGQDGAVVQARQARAGNGETCGVITDA